MDDPRRYITALRARRRALGITQKQFGAEFGHTNQWAYKTERHKTDDQLSLGFYRRAAEVLRLDCRLELTLKQKG